MVDFSDIQIIPDAFLNTREESRIKLLITIVSSLPTAIGSMERIASKLLVRLIEVGVAAHAVARRHAI